MQKIFLLSFMWGCLLPLSSRAMDLKQAKFTQVVNKVFVFSAANKVSHSVALNDIFKMPDALRTGANSRAELVAADKTITRVGANTIFSYDNESRTIDLQQGSLLFHSEPRKGGGTIRTSAAVAAVVGTTIIVTCTPDGGFKVLDLEGEVEITFKNGQHQYLEPGQMTFVLPGATQRAPIIIFRLDSEIKDSLLVSGFVSPLPSLPKINGEVTRQLLQILNNQLNDTGLIVGNTAAPGQVQVYEDLATVNFKNRQLVVNSKVSSAGDISLGSDSSTLAFTLISGSSLDSSGGSVGVTTAGDIAIGASVSSGISTTLTAAGNIDAGGANVSSGVNTTLTAGDTLSLDASVVAAISQVALSGVNGVNITATIITATDPQTGAVGISTGGTITVDNGSSITAPAITLNAGDGILLDGTSGTFSGNILNLTAVNTTTVQNVDLTAFPTINISAHTINLINVAFGNGSSVNLHSLLGILALLPNTGLPSVPGEVNFIRGVTYGGTTVTALNEGRFITVGAGAGIHISTLP
jgi:hypothetical protein